MLSTRRGIRPRVSFVNDALGTGPRSLRQPPRPSARSSPSGEARHDVPEAKEARGRFDRSREAAHAPRDGDGGLFARMKPRRRPKNKRAKGAQLASTARRRTAHAHSTRPSTLAGGGPGARTTAGSVTEIPRTGNVHVDKSGDTCAAGAGSILIGGYHGFLHNGYLTDG